jgi:cell fate (sporulation/competence/biofilm development) regulator YlbF (YheA/YmcA/DUF963 family)
MPVDTPDILAEADKLGNLVAQHPAVAKYKQAQRSVAEDPDASRLLTEFDRTLETLGRQEQSGMPVTDAQRQKLESLQSQIMSHIKMKALNMAQVDFVDLLRKVNQAIQSKLMDTPPGRGATSGAGAGAGAGPADPRTSR